jgi:hypothetical protein
MKISPKILALLAFSTQIKGVGVNNKDGSSNSDIFHGKKLARSINNPDHTKGDAARAAQTLSIFSSRVEGVGAKGKGVNDKRSSPTSDTSKSTTSTASKYDYTKGDDARTVQEFAEAIKGDYKVTYNNNALKPDVFTTNPIMVYGEIHTHPKLPSLRNPEGKGAVLLESNHPEFCRLEKYNQHPSNVCEHIDTVEEKVVTELARSLLNIATKQKELIGLIHSKGLSHVKARVDPSHDSAWPLIMAMDSFIETYFQTVYDYASPEKKGALAAAYQAFLGAVDDNNRLVSSKDGEREDIMAENAIQAIQGQDDDAAAIVVVGDAHRESVTKKLENAFAERAIVSSGVID